MEGWISFHRKFLNWEWYDDLNTKSLFIHCLLKANHKGKKWRGIDINKGSFITSRASLCNELKLSEQQIRTALKKLESTNEITIKTTKLNTLISISNWNKYQADNQPSNQVATNKQPTSNQVATTTNNDNKENNEDNGIKKEKSVKKIFTPPTLDQVLIYFKENNYNESTAKKAFNYYDIADWKDSRGNKIKNWKQKMQGVWFKDENKMTFAEINKPFNLSQFAIPSNHHFGYSEKDLIERCKAGEYEKNLSYD